MNKFKKLSVVFLLIGSLFFTGCDAGQIAEMIQKVVQGIEKALPAIKNAVEAFKGVMDGDATDNTAPAPVAPVADDPEANAATPTTTPTSAATTEEPVENEANTDAGVTIPSTSDEEVTISDEKPVVDTVETQVEAKTEEKIDEANVKLQKALTEAKARVDSIKAEITALEEEKETHWRIEWYDRGKIQKQIDAAKAKLVEAEANVRFFEKRIK